MEEIRVSEDIDLTVDQHFSSREREHVSANLSKLSGNVDINALLVESLLWEGEEDGETRDVCECCGIPFCLSQRGHTCNLCKQCETSLDAFVSRFSLRDEPLKDCNDHVSSSLLL